MKFFFFFYQTASTYLWAFYNFKLQELTEELRRNADKINGLCFHFLVKFANTEITNFRYFPQRKVSKYSKNSINIQTIIPRKYKKKKRGTPYDENETIYAYLPASC